MILITISINFSYSYYKWQIKVDNQPPQINGCPRNIEETIELGASTKVVTWTDPTATDNTGTPSRTRSHQPGVVFTLGVTNVRYTFTDTYNNVATCTFTVTLTTGWFYLFENNYCMWSFCDVIYSNHKRFIILIIIFTSMCASEEWGPFGPCETDL